MGVGLGLEISPGARTACGRQRMLAPARRDAGQEDDPEQQGRTDGQGHPGDAVQLCTSLQDTPKGSAGTPRPGERQHPGTALTEPPRPRARRSVRIFGRRLAGSG